MAEVSSAVHCTYRLVWQRAECPDLIGADSHAGWLWGKKIISKWRFLTQEKLKEKCRKYVDVLERIEKVLQVCPMDKSSISDVFVKQ